MTESEFYATIGGDYTQALSRLMKDSLIRRFVLKFPQDESFRSTVNAVEACDWDGAFSASHTLKGVALNLSFKNLGASASALTEALRPQTRGEVVKERINELLFAVQKDYYVVLDAIAKLGE